MKKTQIDTARLQQFFGCWPQFFASQQQCWSLTWRYYYHLYEQRV